MEDKGERTWACGDITELLGQTLPEAHPTSFSYINQNKNKNKNKNKIFSRLFNPT